MTRDTVYHQMLWPGILPETWGAEYSQCDRYRYRLWRTWDESRAPLVFCMLNPSTATHEVNDPTVTRCMERASMMDYGGVIVLNAFAWRDTDPEKMKAAADPTGPYNDEVILEVCRAAPLVICAWGKHGTHRQRDAQLLALLRENGVEPWALGFNGDGTPKHPLYVPYSTKLAQIPPKIIVTQ